MDESLLASKGISPSRATVGHVDGYGLRIGRRATLVPDDVDGRLYESFDAFVDDARAFYSTLRAVHVAAWDAPRVDVLSDRAAAFTAQVRWASTDSAGVRIDLRGVWTAVWLRGPEGWLIAARHESFLPETGASDAAV
jgi:hypothetical protein